MRVIGLDVHRSFAVAAFLEDGQLRTGQRIVLEHDAVVQFARTLRPDDEVVVEATGNTAAVVRLIAPHVRRVAIANPLQTRAIASAKVKTDKIDAGVLAKLHASGFLPEVWSPDEDTLALRRLVAERVQLVTHMTRLKNRIHSVLHANLIPPYGGKLFTRGGRAWLAELPLAQDQRRAIERHLREFDRTADEIATMDRALARRALDDPRAQRLMTVGGINAVVAISLLAAIGDVGRFSSPEKLVSYFGLNPRVRQSGDRPAYHGRISKQGRAHARAMLVEAAWAVATGPGPLRAFFIRIRQRRGDQVAAVATARKLAVLTWHLLSKGTDYAWARPALVAWKRRKLELQSGEPSHRGGNKPGPASEYSLRDVRDREREWLGMAEEEYRQFVSAWQTQPPPGRKPQNHTK
jgi:transposase